MAFRVVYDPAVLTFSNRSLPVAPDPRPINGDDAPVSLSASPHAVSGQIIVGLTRLAGRTGGIDFPSGANVVMRLHFSAAGEGTTVFSFEPGSLIADEDYGSTLTGVAGLTWVDGTSATVVRECL
jgi:hypothetical protein